MSNSDVVPVRVGEQMLLGVVATLLLSSMLFAGVVWATLASGARPSNDDVRTPLAFASVMLAAIGILRPLARHFDIRHKARLERMRSAVVAYGAFIR